MKAPTAIRDYPTSTSLFYSKFPNDKAALEWLGRIRWSKGFICPSCGNKSAWKTSQAGERRCTACNKKTGALAGTALQDQKLGAKHLLEIAWLMTWEQSGVSAASLARKLGISRQAAWLALQKYRQVMHTEMTKLQLTGVVEVDETFLGGGKGMSGKHCVVVLIERRKSGGKFTANRLTCTEKPVVLGQSFGGFVAQEIATRYPEFASAVVLSSTASREGEEEVLDAFLRIGGEEVREVVAAFFAEQNEETWKKYKEKADPCYNTTEQPESKEADIDSEMLFYFWSREHGEMNYLSSLHRIKCPTLVVVGREDPITPWPMSLEIVNNLECDTELAVADGAGHGVWRDRPDYFFGLVNSFLRRHLK